jgi:hypothetical protein
MITANFKAYASYITDSLHQWDLNQVLQVSGLNLTKAPEVHFSNANTDRAIVRQATMNAAGVVTVGVPNSLLQDSLRIYAHIGIYEGNTFKVVELVEIPVIPRKRPQDYQIQDTDEEIYSFKALENALTNRLTRADVVDNLDSADGTVPLSANQGRILAAKVVPKKLSACVVFSPAYKNASGADFIASSMAPLANAESYPGIAIGDVKILGTNSTVGASRFNVSPYGVGFTLISTDSMAVQTVAGKVVSFEFTLTE